jgi:hypothetical protein
VRLALREMLESKVHKDFKVRKARKVILVEMAQPVKTD